jgi:hypothetical protein
MSFTPTYSPLSVAVSFHGPQQQNSVIEHRYLAELFNLSRCGFRRNRISRARVYDDCMATWEDGPEYAPIERPSEFQNPDAPPLETAPPYTQMAAWAPKYRPVFDVPEGSVVPLSTLTPVREEPRDPQKPFAVASSTMTSDSAWGAVHWAPPSGSPTALATTAGWTPPAGAHHPPPDQPLGVRGGVSPTQSNFPTPGTPDWFGPGPYGHQPRQTSPVTAKAVLDAATPGLCICLVIGGLVYVVSPIVLWIALGLAGRVKVAQEEVRRAFRIGIGLLAILGILGTLIVDTGFGDWWGFLGSWGLVLCWGLLISTLVLIYRRLKADSTPPPTYGSPWE